MILLKIHDETINSVYQITEVNVEDKTITLSSGYTYKLTTLAFKEIENVVKENERWCN